jgi:RimJ/RimL family protein N-acetyltransferase
MQLLNLTTDDLALYESMNCDPRMMAHLGGPLPKESMPQKLLRDVETIKSGTAWIFKVIPDGNDGQPAGSVCIWEHAEGVEQISEIGWMILPQFQGRGLGSKAVRAILDKAQAERRWDVIHAFPATGNGASNAICRKLGFTLIEERDLEWSGRKLHCNHWRIDLRERQK